jgi:cell division protein FtsQ
MPGSDAYAPEEAIPARPVLSPRLEKLFKGLLVTALILAAGELIWFFVISPCMPFSRIEISGFQGLDRSVILAQAGIDGRSSYMSVRTRAVEKALAALPQVEEVRVIKTFPASVELVLAGRKALGALPVRNGDRQALAIFDKEGVIFKIVNPGDSEALSLPLVSGMNFREIRLGSRPQGEAFYGSFLDRLAGIRSSAPELLQSISEIRINRKVFEEAGGKGFAAFDLSLYFMQRPVRVLAGADLDEDGLRYMLLTVDALLSRESRIDEIDFRAGIASYTLKEASSG